MICSKTCTAKNRLYGGFPKARLVDDIVLAVGITWIWDARNREVEKREGLSILCKRWFLVVLMIIASTVTIESKESYPKALTFFKTGLKNSCNLHCCSRNS